MRGKSKRERTTTQIVDEVRKAQAKATPITITIRVTLTCDQLRALNEHIDRDPSRAFAPLQDPGRTDVSSPLSATSMLPPAG